jgi:hypothetical protein
MPVLVAITPRELPWALRRRGYSILSAGADGAADVPIAGFGHGAGVGGALGGEGALHLGEQRQEQEGDAAHALVGGVDRQRVGQGPDVDAASGEAVDEVEDLAEVAADAVEGMHDDRVAGPGVAEQLVQAVVVDGAAGLLAAQVRSAGMPAAARASSWRSRLCFVVETPA